GHYRAMLGNIFDDHDPIDVACAALKLAAAGEMQGYEDADYDFGDTGATPGMVRFFVNIGRSSRLSPADLVRAISDESGVPRQAIGKIDIFDRFTFIEVEEESAPFVYEALRQSRINGARVNLEPAKPRSRVR
ncbi:MAG: DbpA RNA binding domain-containing protein, partial [Alicyclobacillus sp.]|nr:DbpA RNA binding domain-containing protein [Alicyclobacillus sp.]